MEVAPIARRTKMNRLHTFIATAASAALVSAVGLGISSTPAQAQVVGEPLRFDCQVYIHRDFQGNMMGYNRRSNVSYVGDTFQDAISSLAVRRGCRIILYHHRNFGGDRKIFRRSYSYVGDVWSDIASSFKCRCN